MGFEIERNILKKYHEEEGVTAVTIPESVTAIGEKAFYNCVRPESIILPEGLTTMGEFVFFGCKNLRSITIPDGVKKIGKKAFCCCISLESITIPESVTEIGEWAFGLCGSLKEITIPDGVEKIGRRAFCCCGSFRSITIPDSVTEIGYEAFYYCDNLESVVLPSDIENVSVSAFQMCRKLREIKIRHGSKIISFDRKNFLKYLLSPDGKKVFEFLNADDDRREEIFPEIKKTGVKIMLAFAVINESEVARKYIRRYVIKAVAYFTDREDVESIEEILATGFVTKKNIYKMIEYAIDSKKPEIQLILMNYKKENFGFSGGFDGFIL